MTNLIRVLFLLTFALFWGGLTFYTGFVVRISHDVLDAAMDGGLITQRVTAVLQMLGVAAVLLMACNGLALLRISKWYAISLLTIAVVLAFAILGLFIVHGQLDAVIDIAAYEISDRDAFDANHRRYNQLTTVEWLSSLAYLVTTVFAWKHADANSLSRKTDEIKQ